MSGSGQNEQESRKEDGGEAGRDDMYRPKHVSTVVRVLTVLAYLLSVSLAAILLSVYYICVWKSPELPPIGQARIGFEARRGEDHEYHQNYTNDSLRFTYSGGSNITVNSTEQLPINLQESTYDSTREPSGPDWSANLTIETTSTQTTHDNATPPDVSTYDTNNIT